MDAEQISNDDLARGQAATARRTVVEQHLELRRLLTMGLAQAHAADHRQVFLQHLPDEDAHQRAELEGL